jgi:hypothetical protein
MVSILGRNILRRCYQYQRRYIFVCGYYQRQKTSCFLLYVSCSFSLLLTSDWNEYEQDTTTQYKCGSPYSKLHVSITIQSKKVMYVSIKYLLRIIKLYVMAQHQSLKQLRRQNCGTYEINLVAITRLISKVLPPLIRSSWIILISSLMKLPVCPEMIIASFIK